MPLLRNKTLDNHGFTLVELLIAMVISAIIVAAIYSTYKMQRDVYEAQDQITEVQQTLRAATWQMIREIRMAGFDPAETGEAKIVAAEKDLLYFTLDLNEDGDVDQGGNDTGEHIAYDLYVSSGKSTLGRTAADQEIKYEDKGGGHWEVTPAGAGDPSHFPFAYEIKAIEFNYILEDGTTTTTVSSSADKKLIRAIQLSILAQTRYRDRNYFDSLTYTTASGDTWGPYNDNHRRRMLITTVTCRNMGL